MLTFSISEAKDRFSEIVALAERGEEITITRHGKKAIKLSNFDDEDAREESDRRGLWDRLAAHRARMRAEGKTVTLEEIIAWRDEGRR